MEIAIGIVFLALFTGALFLLILIIGFIIWRKLKWRNSDTKRQFSATRSQFAENDSIDDNYSDDNDFAFAEASDYAESSSNNSEFTTKNNEVSASMSFENASEGGENVSSGSNSSASYDSSSSSDSSSCNDSGSSSSNLD